MSANPNEPPDYRKPDKPPEFTTERNCPSSKKAKGGDGVEVLNKYNDQEVCVSPNRRKFSYKQSLVGHDEDDTDMDVIPETNAEVEAGNLGSDSDEEIEEDEDDSNCPTVRVPSWMKKKLWKPWENSLIVKVLGKRVGFRYLYQRLSSLWSIKGILNLIDLSNDYYIAKFDSRAEYDKVVEGGPYIISDHVLSMQPWRPHFDPNDNEVHNILTWVRFPGLPIEYYNPAFMTSLGALTGRVHHVDKKTVGTERGKFARVCVELDLKKPLLSKYKLRKRVYRIEYEGLHTICFECGMYGHSFEHCPKKVECGPPVNDATNGNDLEFVVREEVVNNYGPWMIAKRPNRRRGTARQMAVNNKKVAEFASVEKVIQRAEKIVTVPVTEVISHLEEVDNGNVDAGMGGSRFAILAEEEVVVDNAARIVDQNAGLLVNKEGTDQHAVVDNGKEAEDLFLNPLYDKKGIKGNFSSFDPVKNNGLPSSSKQGSQMQSHLHPAAIKQLLKPKGGGIGKKADSSVKTPSVSRSGMMRLS